MAIALTDGQIRSLIEAPKELPADFEVTLRRTVRHILGYCIPGSTRVFLLRRYNGKHAHTNKIEREKIDDFHIHEATERYQAIGPKEEGYAVPTKRYSNLTAALACLLKDCNFREPPEAQQSLFPSR